jgi:hypothetical protein
LNFVLFVFFSIFQVKLSNPDGAFSLFSAITTKSPSGNLFGWVPTAPTFINMRIGRRGHALIVGKATKYKYIRHFIASFFQYFILSIFMIGLIFFDFVCLFVG